MVGWRGWPALPGPSHPLPLPALLPAASSPSLRLSSLEILSALAMSSGSTVLVWRTRGSPGHGSWATATPGGRAGLGSPPPGRFTLFTAAPWQVRRAVAAPGRISSARCPSGLLLRREVAALELTLYLPATLIFILSWIHGWIPRMAVLAVSPASSWTNHRPGVVVRDWGLLIWVCLCRLPSFDLGLHSLELLLDLADELGQVDNGWGIGRVDCVSAHALLRIGKYPRGTIGSRSAH